MFLLLTFLMPFFFVLCQRYTGLPVLQLLFYGLEAASPSIAALLVLSKNRQLLSFFKKNFKGWKSGTALLFPCVFSLAPMLLASIIWFLWHYHYFYQNGIEVPLLSFFIGCIAESFVYEYLLQWSEGNLLSSMTYHFSWNLCIHLFAINPADNAGNEFPYILMTLFEVSMVLLLLAHDKSRHMHKLPTK